jgi:hypothetical protein
MADKRFTEQVLDDLLAGLQARAQEAPDNPGLIACWPSVREDQMAAGCAELIRRGHPVKRVAISTRTPGVTRIGWTVSAPSDSLAQLDVERPG